MMAQFVFWLAVGFAGALGACVLVGLLCKTGEKLRALRRAGWACVMAAIVAIIHGGTKNITNRFTADTGLAVVMAEITVPTNGVDSTTMSIAWTGPDAHEPIYVRNGNSENWKLIDDLRWEPDGMWWWQRSYENGTNTILATTADSYAAATNVTIWAQWHIGTDLPPVEIDGDGISLVDFRDSSTNVVISYSVDRAVLGDNAGTVRVEVQEDRGAVWMEVRWDAVSGGVTNTVTIPGFWINRDTRWRVRLEVDE